MLQIAQRSFREFNAIQDDADIRLCNAICVELEVAEEGWFVERLRYDMGEGVFVKLPEEQELIVIVYRGEISIHINLKYDCPELQEKYGLTEDPNHQFEFVGCRLVKDVEQVLAQVRLLMSLV